MTNLGNLYDSDIQKQLTGEDLPDQSQIDFFSGNPNKQVEKELDVQPSVTTDTNQPEQPNLADLLPTADVKKPQEDLTQVTQPKAEISTVKLTDISEGTLPKKEETTLPDPAVTTTEPPADYVFKFLNVDKNKIPRRIRKQLYQTYYDTDVKASGIAEEISTSLGPKYQQMLSQQLSELAGKELGPDVISYDKEQGKLIIKDNKARTFLDSQSARDLEKVINDQYNKEFQTQFSDRTKGIYLDLKNTEQNVLNQLPSISKINRAKQKLENVSSTLDGYIYSFHHDEDFPAVSQMMMEIKKELAKPESARNNELINYNTDKISRYYDLAASTKTKEMQFAPGGGLIYYQDRWWNSLPRPTEIIEASTLKEGDTIFTGDGEKNLYFPLEDGNHQIKTLVDKTDNYWTPRQKTEMEKFAEDAGKPQVQLSASDLIGPQLTANIGQGVTVPVAPDMYAEAERQKEEKYKKIKEETGTDPRDIVLRKEDGQPEADIEYWKVIKSGTHKVYGVDAKDEEYPIGDGLSVVPVFKNRENYGIKALGDVVVSGGTLSQEQRDKAKLRNATLVSNITKAFAEESMQSLSKEDLDKLSYYFNPENLLSFSAAPGMSKFLSTINVGEPTGKYGLPEYTDKFVKWIVSSGKFKDINEFSPVSMMNASIQFMNEEVASKEQEIKNFVFPNGMNGREMLDWVNTESDLLNEYSIRVKQINDRIQTEISLIDEQLKKNPNDEKLKARRNALALTNNNNITRLKYEFQKREDVTSMPDDEKFQEVANIDQEKRDFSRLASESAEIFKSQQETPEQRLAKEEAAYQAANAASPFGISRQSWELGNGFLNRGLSFINSTLGFLGQVSARYDFSLDAEGRKKSSDVIAAQTEQLQGYIDDVTKKSDLSEKNADGTTNWTAVTANQLKVVGGAAFDLVSTAFAPEFRLIKGAGGAAAYFNRLPGLAGMWTMGNFYQDYKEAESAGVPKEYRMSHVFVKNFVQSAIENIVDVRKFIPKNPTLNFRAAYGEVVDDVMPKILNQSTRAAGIKELASNTAGFLKNYFKGVGSFYIQEFAFEESLAKLANGLQNEGANLLLNSNLDESRFSWEEQKNNFWTGITLGGVLGMFSASGGTRLGKQQKYLMLSQAIEEFGPTAVHNTLTEISRSKKQGVDLDLANEMIGMLPYMTSMNKPSSMSNVKWLSVRAFLSQKEKLINEQKGSPSSLSSLYDTQIKQIDEKISEVLNIEDDALSESLRSVGVTVLTNDKGVPFFVKQKQDDNAEPQDIVPAQTVETPGASIESQIAELENKKASEIEKVNTAITQSQTTGGQPMVDGQVVNSQTIADISTNYDSQINDLKSKIPQYATQESTRAQQESAQQGRIGEYAPAQQGQQIQGETTQPATAYSDSDISRQREVVKGNVAPVVQSLKALPIESEDGATFNQDGTAYTGGGLVVPIVSKNTTVQDLNDDAIADFANEHKSLLDTGLFKIGVYKFPNSNNASIDLNMIADPKNLDAALDMSRQMGHESIFNLDTFENIKTGADGMNIRSLTPAQISRAASDVAAGRKTNIDKIVAETPETQPTTTKPAPPAFTPSDVVRMSDARSMAYDEFKSKYPNATPESYERVKESGYESEEDYNRWAEYKSDRANQIASDIRDVIENNRNGLTSSDMKTLSKDMQRAWSRIVPGLQLVWDNYDQHVQDAGYPEEYKDYAGFYDHNTKTVYLNPNKIGLDTPIHEFGHVWFAVAKIVDQKLIDRGRALIRGTEYDKRVRNTPEYADMADEDIEEEALITAIGEKGAGIIDQMAKRNFRTWLSDLWKTVASKFGVKINIEDLTLDEFLHVAAMDIISGGQVLLKTTSPVEVVQSGVNRSIVSANRLASQSAAAKNRLNTAIKMQDDGATSDEIWEATGMENIQGQWTTELDYNASLRLNIPDAKKMFEDRGIVGARWKLGDIMSYPSFFQMFPKAKDIVVSVANFDEEFAAAYNESNDNIYLNVSDNVFNYLEGDYMPSMLHEIQHFIQTKEGWQNGTNTAREFERARKVISQSHTKAGDPDTARKVDGLQYGEAYEGDLKDLYKGVMYGAQLLYKYNLGEVQSRNVEARYKYNPEERAKLSPVSTQDKRPKYSTKSAMKIGKEEISAVKDVMQSKDYAKFMTEDANNYYFFHWSGDQRKVIDPAKFGNNTITSREERIARPSAAFFYTRPDFAEPGVGQYGHIVAIPKDKVYPATSDPLNFYDEAKIRFEKSHPGMAFGPNQQIGWVTKIANEKGFDMVVAKWGKQLRAETTNKVKPEWYAKPEGWSTVTNPKYAKLKRGFNETVGTGKIKAAIEPGIPLSFNDQNRIPGMSENIKRASINDFAGKEAVIIASDRLTTAMVDYPGFKNAHRKLGGIFYAAANKGFIWASSTKGKAQSIINDIVYDENGYGYIAIMAMANDSHMSNYNSILFASDMLKTLKLPSSVVADRINKASRRATGEDIVSSNDSIAKMSEKINKYFSVESARFDARKPFLVSLLGNTKSGLNELGMPDFKSVSEMLSEPSLSGLRNGTIAAIMRFSGTPSVAETSAEKDGETYHQSYPFAIKAQGDVDVFLLDEAHEVEKVLPEFINRGGKKISYAEAQMTYKELAPARYVRNIFLSQPTAKLSVSSRFGVEDGWGQKAIGEAFDMLRGGIFEIKENTSVGGFDLVYNGGTIEAGVPMDQAESVRDEMIKKAIMKGYPQITEMTADNILSNAKRRNISKPLKKVENNIGQFNSRGFNNKTKSTPVKIVQGIKRWFTKNFTLSQGLPKWMRTLKESRTGNISYMVSRAEGTVNDLKKIAKKIGFDDWKTFDEALRDYRTHTPSNPYWTGNQQGFQPANTQSQAFMSLPDEIKPFVVSMRSILDGISEQLVRNGLVSPDLALTLEGNMGTYVHRSYAMYTIGQKWIDSLRKQNKDWANSGKQGTDIIDTAHKNLVQLYAAHIMSINPNLSIDQVTDMANNAADVEIERILQSKTPVFGSDESSFLPYRNTGVLQQRQAVPEWLRNLLGEFEDPGTAFLLSVSESATLLHTSAYLAKMRDNGLGTVFFEEGNAPQEASVRISAMGAMLKPLDGLYTTPEMYEVLNEAENSVRQGWPLLLKVMNINKMMKTIFSPVTQAKNFTSNTLFAINNGHFDVTRMGAAWKYFRGQIVNNQAEALLDKLKPLFVRGVLNQSLTARELGEIFKTDDFEKYVLDNADNAGGINFARAMRKVGRGSSRIYQASDDFWKIYAFYNEQQDLSKALFGKKYDQLDIGEKDTVDNEAADRVMNTYPTYDRVLGIFKGLNKAAVFGNFISFRAESFRVLGNTIAYSFNDIARGIKEKNPRLVALGTKRFMGMATYNAARMEGVYWGAKYAGLGVSGVISSIWAALYGSDDEEEERQAINSWVPKYAIQDDKIYNAKQVKDGKITFYPLGSIDPYASIYNIFNAYAFGNEYDRDGGVIAAGLEVVAPFVEPEMVIDNIMSATKNKDQYGWMIYNEGDDTLKQFFEGTKYVAKKTMIPGAYSWYERITTTRDEEGRKIPQFNPEEIFLAPFGRFYDVDMNRTWKSKLYNAKNVIFAQVEQDFNEQKKEGVNFADEANFKYNREILRLHKMYKDGITLGFPQEKLDQILKDVKLDRKIIHAIKTGETFQVFDEGGKITIERIKEMLMRGEMPPGQQGTQGGEPLINLLP